MQVLRILLPVVWAVVAAVIGWLLYKRSTSRIELKWVAFTGAAVIAAAAFYGMYRATPTGLLADPQLGAAARAAGELVNATRQAAKECIAQPDPQRLRCADAMQDLHARSAQLQELLYRMTGE